MNRHRLAAAVACALLAAATARAGSGPLTELLKERQQRIDAMLATDTDLDEVGRAKLADVLAELIDFREMSRRALGREWKERSDAERDAFVARFERLVRANSVRRVDVYKADGVAYGEETTDGDEGKVRTTFETDKALTDVDYDFLKTGDRWSIVDYDIDGISTVSNYKRQFRKLLRKRGWDGMLQRLEERAAEIEAENEG